jgi:hypothetical protein
MAAMVTVMEGAMAMVEDSMGEMVVDLMGATLGVGTSSMF